MKILRIVAVMFVMGLVGAENPVSPTSPPSTSPPSTSPTSSTVRPPSSSTPLLPTGNDAASSQSSSTASSSTAVEIVSSSTTPPPSSTTPAPQTSTTPAPKPKEYFWSVTEDGVTCILAKAEIKLSLAYKNGSSKKEVKIDVPQNATSSGQCGNSSQILELRFGDNAISFNFTKNGDRYHIARILSNITVGKDNDTRTLSLTSGDLNLYDTHLNTSYTCSWSEPATLHEDDAQRNVTDASIRVTLNKMRFEAFRNSTEDTFSKEYSCPMDSPDIVPVMVGIALGILVAVVLIAYLVGRRSTQAQGYLSM